jgi:transcriptional regulator with PAS, ATPase and Fis domain
MSGDSASSSPVLPNSSSSRQVFWNQPQNKLIESRALVFRSEVMVNLMRMVDRVATSSANILIMGESGTGKELIARSVHEKSQRKGRPFVAINCGALRETLLESELFGHEKGSFTGAYTKKIGLAESANGGTLFLDEIGELSSGIQAKLLRFIQEGEIYRVGGKDPIKVDIRLISATNRDLESEVKKGNFREDLYYRINTIVVDVPPLRRRKDDIPLLIQNFLQKSDLKTGLKGKEIDVEALEMVMRYDWPGNVRELQNVCERLQILTEGHTIMPSDLPENIANPAVEVDTIDYDPSISLGVLEKRYILKALHYFEGNKTQAAQALGITIKTLYNKLHEYGEFERFATQGKKTI